MTVQLTLRASAAVGDFLHSGFPMKDQILFVKSMQYKLNNIGDIPRRSHHPAPRFVVSAFSSTVADLVFMLPFLTTSFSPISLLIVSFFQGASQCIPYSAIMTTCLLQLAHGWSVRRLINSWMWLWTTAVKSKCLAGVLWRVYRGSAAEPKRWSWVVIEINSAVVIVTYQNGKEGFFLLMPARAQLCWNNLCERNCENRSCTCLFNLFGFLSEILGCVLHYLFAPSASFQEKKENSQAGEYEGEEGTKKQE